MNIFKVYFKNDGVSEEIKAHKFKSSGKFITFHDEYDSFIVAFNIDIVIKIEKVKY